MRIRGEWLGDTGLRRVMQMLTRAGHRALIVGGAVRNDLLQQPITDIDIATSARPETVAELAQAAAIKAVPTGIEHGTVTLVTGGRGYEVTTFRRDVETDGRRAVVAYTDAIEEDAARRDFTMNALYATPGGEVIDPVGGLDDLAVRRLRFVGDPATRIAEDYLRILRLYRFWAQYGDVNPATHAPALAAIRPHVAGLAQVSCERVGAEMRKLLAAPDPAPMLADMQDAGVLAAILPGADARLIPALIAHEGDAPPVALRRLAALGGDDPAGALRLSRNEARDLAAIRAGAGQPPDVAGYWLGAARGRDAMLLARSQGRVLPGDWAARVAQGAAAVFPVRAADLPGFSGKALGDKLRALEDEWIASGFTLSRNALLMR